MVAAPDGDEQDHDEHVESDGGGEAAIGGHDLSLPARSGDADVPDVVASDAVDASRSVVTTSVCLPCGAIAARHMP